MKIFKLVIIPVLLLYLVPTLALAALDLPKTPQTYVSDFASLLSASQEQALEQKLAALEKTSSNQVLVVTVPSLEGETVEEYALRLAEKWKPGQTGRDNGVILLVAPKERKVRIEVGYGLEGALPDATAKNIIETQIIPSFKKGDFPGGITSGVSAIIAATQGEYEAQPLKNHGDASQAWAKWWGLFMAFFFLVMLRTIYRRHRAFGVDRRGGHILPLLIAGLSDFGGRSGGSSGGGFSGGGFSSGGGSFGGGGASGGW